MQNIFHKSSNSHVDLLKYKIEKYKHKYDQLQNQSGGSLSRDELLYKIAKYEHKMNQIGGQIGGMWRMPEKIW